MWNSGLQLITLKPSHETQAMGLLTAAIYYTHHQHSVCTQPQSWHYCNHNIQNWEYCLHASVGLYMYTHYIWRPHFNGGLLLYLAQLPGSSPPPHPGGRGQWLWYRLHIICYVAQIYEEIKPCIYLQKLMIFCCHEQNGRNCRLHCTGRG